MNEFPRLRKLFDWPMLVGFLVGAATTIFIIYPPQAGWGDRLKWGDISGWAQAIGSIVAIAGAFGVANWQHERARELKEKDARLLARDRALVIVLPLRRWRDSFKCVNGDAENSEEMNTNRLEQLDNWLRSYSTPKAIRELIGRYHELGSAAEPVQNLVFLHGNLMADIRELTSVLRGDYSNDEEDQRVYVTHFTLLAERLDLALSAAVEAVVALLK